MSLSRRELFGSLATLPYKALESATAHARLLDNPYVELAHWLHQILGQPDSDCHRLLREAGADLDLIIREIAAAIAVLPSGAGSSIDFSHTVEQATDRAWMTASLRFGASRTRSGALLWALSTDPELRRATQAASPALARVALEQLSPRWDELLAGSPEADGAGSLTRVTPQGEDAPDARGSDGSALARYQWRVAGEGAASSVGAAGALWNQPNAGRDPQANSRSGDHDQPGPAHAHALQRRRRPDAGRSGVRYQGGLSLEANLAARTVCSGRVSVAAHSSARIQSPAAD